MTEKPVYALPPDLVVDLLLDPMFNDLFEVDFCVCDYRPKRKCFVHPSVQKVN